MTVYAHIDLPTLDPGWEWAPKEAGYDVRRCVTCGRRQAYIWHKWVDDLKRKCGCRDVG